jgi:hypothetical protein
MTSIIIDSLVPTENQLKRLGKELGKPAFYILVLVLIFVFAFLFGVNYANAEVRAEMAHITAERDYMQSLLVTTVGDNNRAQSAMGGQLAWITESEYRTGWRDACVAMGQDEDYCYNKAMELVRP